MRHDTTVSEVYLLFRRQDSVARLRRLLIRQWGPSSCPLVPPSAHGRRSRTNAGTGGGGGGGGQKRPRDGGGNGKPGGHPSSSWPKGQGGGSAGGLLGAGAGRRGVSSSVRWSFDVNHRHSIWEGNTLLNFAARCGAIRSASYLISELGAGVDVADDGGFTPLMNAGKSDGYG
ncbi:unnamed protein product [Discosporangium mesarthrocarpum]